MSAPYPNLYRVISAKTTDYRMVPEDIGKIFTHRGAGGAVVLTLPITTDIQVGWNVRVFAADLTQTLTVQCHNSLDVITTFNDLTADSVALSTSSEIAGGAFEFVWDGTGWLCFMMTEETQTVTVA